jgi:hypothetical protein
MQNQNTTIDDLPAATVKESLTVAHTGRRRVTVALPFEENVDFVRIPAHPGVAYAGVWVRLEKLYQRLPVSFGSKASEVTVKFGIRREDENFSRGVTQDFKGKISRGVCWRHFFIPLGAPCDVGMILWAHLAAPPLSDDHIAEVWLDSYELFTAAEYEAQKESIADEHP